MGVALEVFHPTTPHERTIGSLADTPKLDHLPVLDSVGKQV